MARQRFGGAQDYSGVFASLYAEDERRIRAGTDRALSQAKSDEAAEDARVYSQWKNGKISDKEWLAYLRKRSADTLGSPEEHEKWADTLREHEAAIADAQVETKFRLGKITVHELIRHYQKRMRGVEKNSPAWREMAGRFQELNDFAKAGGVHYGDSLSSSGGGGGGSSSKGSARSAHRIATEAAQNGANPAARRPGEALPFSTAGEDLVDPTREFMPEIEDDDQYLDTLMGDLLRIDDLMQQLEENPDAKTLRDTFTGEEFAVTPDLLLEIDKQYLRTQDAFAAIKWSQGKPDDAVRALAEKGDYIASTMSQHNDRRFEPVYRAFEQNTMEQFVAASAIADPQARLQVYRGILGNLEAMENGALPGQGGLGLRATLGEIQTRLTEGVDETTGGNERVSITADLPDELRPSAEFLEKTNGWRNLLTAITDPTLDPESRNAMLDIALRDIPTEGGMTKEQVTSLIEDDPDATSGASDGLVGGMVNLIQLEGLRNSADPTFQGERYTYAMVNGMTKLVPADIVPTASGGMTVVPRGKDPLALAPVAMRVGGKIRTVWAEPQPIDDPRGSAYQLKSSYQDLSAGQWLPSSAIAQLGRGGLQRLVEAGIIERNSVVNAVEMPDGTLWYQDSGTGLLSPVAPPVVSEGDELTGGIKVDDDGVPMLTWQPHAAGYIMGVYGITSREAQRYLEEQVGLGAIDASQYRVRDADGEISETPVETSGMYYNPTDAAWGMGRTLQAGVVAKAEQFAERENARISQRADEWVRTNLSPMERATWRKMGVKAEDFAADRIRQFGEDLGIRLGDDTFQIDERPNADPMVSEIFAEKAAFRAIRARDDAFFATEARRREEEAMRAQPRIYPKPLIERADVEAIVRAPLPVQPVVRARVQVEQSVDAPGPSNTSSADAIRAAIEARERSANSGTRTTGSGLREGF